MGVVSKASLKSAFVAFELGARWGSGKPMVPLLAHNVGVASLPGPLQGINALSCSNPAQLHQFVVELTGHLDAPLDTPAAYQKCIDDVVKLGNTRYREASEATVPPVTEAIDRKAITRPGVAESPNRGPYLGRGGLPQAEQLAHKKLRDGAAPEEVVRSLESRGVPRRMAEELIAEIRRDLRE